MDTLPMGFHVLDNSAPAAKEETLRKSLSLLVARVAHSGSGASERAASFAAQLRREAVDLYMKELQNPSEEMDDPVMLLLEKAQFLNSVRPHSESVTS